MHPRDPFRPSDHCRQGMSEEGHRGTDSFAPDGRQAGGCSLRHVFPPRRLDILRRRPA